LTIPIRNKIQKVIPYVAVIIGVLFILRGLGLGIPYVSPSNMSLCSRKSTMSLILFFNNFNEAAHEKRTKTINNFLVTV
jgi:hypothetical protein